MDNYTLIRCPNCMLNGRTRTLGQLFAGSVRIQSVASEQKREFTTFLGTSFDWVCTCGMVILTRGTALFYSLPDNIGTAPIDKDL